MPAYELIITEPALADLRNIDTRTRQRILNKLKWPAENAESAKHESLSGHLSLFHKLRIGDYRAIYSFSPEQRVIAAHDVGHRTEVYRSRE